MRMFICLYTAVSLWMSLFTGLDYWNGLLEWTTGLTQIAIKYLLSTCTFSLLMLVP